MSPLYAASNTLSPRFYDGLGYSGGSGNERKVDRIVDPPGDDLTLLVDHVSTTWGRCSSQIHHHW